MKAPLCLFKGLAAALLCGFAIAPIANAADTLPPAKPLKVPELKYEKFTMEGRIRAREVLA